MPNNNNFIMHWLYTMEWSYIYIWSVEKHESMINNNEPLYNYFFIYVKYKSSKYFSECQPFAVDQFLLKGNMNNVGAKKVFQCNSGFVDQTGKSSTVCQTSGAWDHVPTCVLDRKNQWFTIPTCKGI